MAIDNTRVKRFSPTSLSDSLDATDEFPGACAALSNLVPDPSTRNVWTCRPGAVRIFTNAGSVISGLVTVFKVVGNIMYGMVDSAAIGDTSRPFAYNLSTNAFVTVSSAAGAVDPLSQFQNPPSCFTGWIPPTMDLVGTNLIVTHPGFATLASGGNYFGWFDISLPAAPVWHSGNLTAGGAITFTSSTNIPLWVCQFNERAYFGAQGSQPAVIATDVLSLKVTNAGQVLTFGDNLLLTAAAALPLSNQLGGIIQALMVFKGITNIYQVTGDFALSNWAVNTLNVATGTPAPNSIAHTPLGLMFIAPDGVRLIDQNAQISDPIGVAGKGVTIPFYIKNTAFPIISASGCDATTLRVSIYNSSSPTLYTWAEYWYNIPRKVWSGPHSLFAGFYFGVYNGTFVTVPAPRYEAIGSAYISDTYPNANSVFTEYGTQMVYQMQSAVLEDNGQMAGSELSEMQIVGSASANNVMTVTLLDPNGNTINTSSITVNSAGLWPYRVDFPEQSVFNRAAISISGNSAAGVRLGDTWMRLKTLGYIPPPPNPPSS